MLIGEPQASPYDWQFRLFGFPIRVAWLFWVVAAALGYQSAMGVDGMYESISSRAPDAGFSTPGVAALLCVWVAATLVSIVLHELGHALAFRYYGIDSQIVLYHMGGLAIPTAGHLYPRAGVRSRLTDWNQIIVSAAGPGLQLLSGIAVAMLGIALGVEVWMVDTFNAWTGWNLGGADPDSIRWPQNALTYGLVNFYVLISILWPLFNLLPVYPLDGGHIVQHVIAIVRRTDGMMEAHVIGAAAGFLVAWWFFTRGSAINALLFLSLAMSNVQALQQRQGPPMW